MGEVLLNGQVVMRLRTDGGGIWAEDRVQIAADRLRAAIAAGLKPSDIVVDALTDKASPRVKALGQVIATVTPDEAKSAGMAPAALAGSWAWAMKKALAIPGLSVDQNSLLIPLNETRVVKTGGAARGPVTVSSASGANKVTGITVDPATGDLTLSGLAPGRDVLTVTREGATATVTIAVQPYAGRFENPRAVVVTGPNVSAELIARHAVASALGAARPNPGAAAQLIASRVSAAPLAAGQTQSVIVPVQMMGTEMIPVSRAVRVPVTNQSLPPAPTGTLFYSNNPERITGFGTLFVGRMPQALATTRVLYHHQSGMARAAWFTVELVNDKDTAAQVQVVGGDAGPVLDTVWVGYKAGLNFLKDHLSDTGAVIEVPARSRVALTATRLAPRLTISGIIQLRLVSGPPPMVRVAADIPEHEMSLPGPLQPVAAVWNEAEAGQAFTVSEHIYPDPVKKIEAAYSIGGRWAFIPLGRFPLAATEGDKKLLGNYGVTYDVQVNLENPTDKEAKARVLFEPSAGMAGGVFLIDGRIVDIPQTSPPAEPVLATYTLAPGAKQTITIKTLPLSGSNYPATIVVRP